MFWLAGFLSLTMLANGLFMLINPKDWYDIVPTVPQTGFFNQHFVRDIGIIYVLIGVGFFVGIVQPGRRIWLWFASTLWLAAHTLFHYWEALVGICSASALVTNAYGVTLPTAVGVAATALAWRVRWKESAAQAPRAAVGHT